MIEGPRFGTVPEGDTWRYRPGAYGIALARGTVLVVDAPDGVYLPGGGIDEGETPAETVAREFLEETGHHVVSLQPHAIAEQVLVADAHTQWMIKQCHFFLCTVRDGADDGLEADHIAMWLTIDEANQRLAEPASRWALQQAVG